MTRGMAESQYTLKQVVAAIAPHAEPAEREKTARQVRHWTLLGLLVPLGAKHTGTGTSRRYGPLEIVKAAILRELSRYGVGVTHLGEDFSGWITDLARREEWAIAEAGERPVFLVMYWSEDGSSVFQIVADQPDLRFLDPRWPGVDHPPGSVWHGVDFGFKSALVLSLTKIMNGLDL